MQLHQQSFSILRTFFTDFPRLDHLITETFKRNKTHVDDKAIIYNEVSAFVRLMPVYFYQTQRNIFENPPDAKSIIDAVKHFDPFDYRKNIDNHISSNSAEWFINFGLPSSFVSELLGFYGEKEVLVFLKRSIQPRPIVARAFKQNIPSHLPFEAIPKIPFAYEFKGNELNFSDEWFFQGWFELQDVSSQLAALLTNPKPNQIVMDACAGSGGKALSMANLMKGKGKVVAVTTHSHEEQEIKRRYSRHQLGNITTIDFQNPKLDQYTGLCDIVWVDAPCSGSGVLRRNPDIIYRLNKTDFTMIAKEQFDLLERYQKFLKPNGRLVYSTCSVYPLENSSVIHQFKTQNSGYEYSNHTAALKFYELELENKNEFIWGFSDSLNSDGFYFTVLNKKD